MIIYLEERPTAHGAGVGDGEDAKLIERVLHRVREGGRELVVVRDPKRRKESG